MAWTDGLQKFENRPVVSTKIMKKLSRYLFLAGWANLVLHPVLPWLLPELFFWQPRNYAYEFMIGGIYLALGIVMIIASKQPEKHKLFVDFCILMNLFHAVVMMAFAILVNQPHHLVGDVVWIGAQAVIPLFVYPWGIKNFLSAR